MVSVFHGVSGMNGDLDGSSWTLLAEFWVSTRMLLRSFAALINFLIFVAILVFVWISLVKPQSLGFDSLIVVGQGFKL